MELDPEGFLVQTMVDVLEELFEFDEGELEGQGKIIYRSQLQCNLALWLIYISLTNIETVRYESGYDTGFMEYIDEVNRCKTTS